MYQFIVLAQFDEKVVPAIKVLRRQGFSWQKILNELKAMNIKTRRGKDFHLSSPYALAKRNKAV